MKYISDNDLGLELIVPNGGVAPSDRASDLICSWAVDRSLNTL